MASAEPRTTYACAVSCMEGVYQDVYTSFMPQNSTQKFALSVTRWIGSPASIIIHTALFVASFLASALGWIGWDKMLLILTTIVSLEAIYLAIFIQMTINYTTQELAEVADDVEEIQEDIDEIQEDVDEIQEDVDELQEDVEDISEDVEEMTEEEKDEEVAEDRRKKEQKQTLDDIASDLRRLIDDVERLKTSHKSDNTKRLL